MKKVNEENIQSMINLYNSGKTYAEISEITGVGPDTISKHIRNRVNKRLSQNEKLTEEDKERICELYQNGKMNEILNEYDFLSKPFVYKLAKEKGIKRDKYFWSEDDIKILEENYGKPLREIQKILHNEHSLRAISCKAIKLGIAEKNNWTDEETKILMDYYSIIPMSEIEKMLPNRNHDSIINHARKLGIKSYYYLNEKYSEEQKEFILNNYKTMADQEIANYLNKPLSGIQEQRRKLGIYYLNKDYSRYENFSKFFRGHIQDWKNASMKSCDYQCIFTGSKDFALHHKYGFNLILKETFEEFDKLNLLKGDNLEDYSKDELDRILQIFSEIHTKYPLGVCVRKDIHDLFHSIYGAGGNTPEQWNIFYEDFKIGKYKLIA